MIDQSDTWRFDMPNLPHEITRGAFDLPESESGFEIILPLSVLSAY